MYKKKLRGFTLAEMLVTLGIIGVVAALTLPALNNNVQYAHIGTALARTMNQLENVNKKILLDNDAGDLTTACGTSGTGYIECLRSYIPGSFPLKYYKNIYSTEAGIALLAYDSTNADSANATSIPEPYTGTYWEVYVVPKISKDISFNSTVAKNITDADWVKNDITASKVFEFLVDSSGAVVPYGGYAYRDYTGDSSTNPKWKNHCSKGGINSGTGIGPIQLRMSCTGSIADNGWRVVYH